MTKCLGDTRQGFPQATRLGEATLSAPRATRRTPQVNMTRTYPSHSGERSNYPPLTATYGRQKVHFTVLPDWLEQSQPGELSIY